ncbi:MAG: nitrilase-related carbon-nitrogen hydrolase [Chthoniobacter sp.]
MSSSKVTLALIQMRCSAEPHENLAKALARVSEAADRGAQIICLQELFASQYFCQVEDHKYFQLAEEIPGPSTDALCHLAKERGVVIVASLFEKRSAGLYHNTAAVIDADGRYLRRTCRWITE